MCTYIYTHTWFKYDYIKKESEIAWENLDNKVRSPEKGMFQPTSIIQLLRELYMFILRMNIGYRYLLYYVYWLY